MLINATTLLNRAWEIYRKRFWVFLGIMTPPVIASLSLTFFILLGTSLLRVDSASLNVLGFGVLILTAFLTLGSLIIQLWSQTALLYAIKDKGEDIGIKESYRRGWNKIISYFWISILSGFIIVGGFFLFFIPGFIFLIWFSFAPFILISEDKKGWKSLLSSKEYVRGNWWSIFWRFIFIGILVWLILYLFVIISSFINTGEVDKICLYIGYMLLAPIINIYSFLIYDNLKSIKNADFLDPKIE